MTTYVGEAIIGLCLLFAWAWIWDQLGNSRAGRLLQGTLLTIIYLGWIGIICFGFFAVLSGAGLALSEGNIGGSIFMLAYGLPCMCVLLAFPISALNYYFKALNRKWGLNLKYLPILPEPGRN